jgi:hypothetical protein
LGSVDPVPWDSSPRVVSRISDSLQLAYRVWERVKKEFPGLRD